MQPPTMQPPTITHAELPTRTLIDYAALAEMVREFGELLLPLDTPGMDTLRCRLSHHNIFTRLWGEGDVATHMLMTTKRSRVFRRTKA